MSIDIFKVMNIYGIKGIILVIIIITISGIFKSKWFWESWHSFIDKSIEWIISKKTKTIKFQAIEESDIINHDVFNYIDFWVYSKIPTFTFSTDYRTIVFKRYLKIYLKTYRKLLSDFVKNGDYKNMDQANLWKNLLNLINEIVHTYEKECANNGVPDIIIDKMKQKNKETIQLTIDLVQSISTSQFYQSDDNLLKLYSILNIILSVLENTISSSEVVCNSINGQLKNLTIVDNNKTYKEP